MNKILVKADSNEAGSSRMAALGTALHDDPRFEWQGYDNLDVDLLFTLSDPARDKQKEEIRLKYPNLKDIEFRIGNDLFSVELKEPADYVASALGPNGHLYSQVLTMREAGNSCMVLVLGSDEDITNAIKDATKTRYRGQERAFQIGSYNDRLIDFEAQCEALGCRVARWKASPWKRLLSTVHKVLTGGNLMSYRPKPANGERELAAAAMLLGQGIGPTVLKPVMADYKLCLVPRNGNARALEDMSGIGKKRAETLRRCLA